MEKPLTELDKFQNAVLTAAAQAVVAEMTQEKLRALAEHFLTEAMAKMRGDGYGTFMYKVKEEAEVVLKDYLKTPTVLALVQKAVEEGVQAALADLPAATRGKVVDKAIAAVASVITAEKSRY
jgi:hypothetical protein